MQTQREVSQVHWKLEGAVSRNLPTIDSTTQNPNFRFSLRAMFVAFTVLTVIIGGAFLFLRTIDQTVMDAYRVWGTGDMLVDYMEANEGRWPHDWDQVREFMKNQPRQYSGINTFEDAQDHMEIDFAFDPASVDTTIQFDESRPEFRAVWLRNRKTTHYEGSGANEIIFRYLKSRAPSGSPATPQAQKKAGG